MGYSQYDQAMNARVSWNVGKKVGTKRSLRREQISTVRISLDK